jgi:hypothetical protein
MLVLVLLVSALLNGVARANIMISTDGWSIAIHSTGSAPFERRFDALQAFDQYLTSI